MPLKLNPKLFNMPVRLFMIWPLFIFLKSLSALHFHIVIEWHQLSKSSISPTSRLAIPSAWITIPHSASSLFLNFLFRPQFKVSFFRTLDITVKVRCTVRPVCPPIVEHTTLPVDVFVTLSPVPAREHICLVPVFLQVPSTVPLMYLLMNWLSEFDDPSPFPKCDQSSMVLKLSCGPW